MRFRTLRNQWTGLFLPLIIIGWLGGCSTYPRVKGEWIGRIVPVEVYDRKGVAHAASEFKIVKGPKLPERAKYYAGRTPLLVDAEDRILDPSPFDPNVLVVIKGIMSTYSPMDPAGKWIVGRDPTRISPSLAIRVRGKPKILKDQK